MRDIHFPGRSAVYGMRGAVATSQPLASEAAMEILRAGGNAVDAAIAACAVQSVTEPMGTGPGGDCFAIVWLAKQQRVIAINGSGRAPRALSAESLMQQGITSIGPTSVHSVTVPGAVDAWCRLNADHGRLELAEILAASIHYAEHGFAVAPATAVEWQAGAPHLAPDPASAAQYLSEGRAPKAGDVWRMPALARTLRMIAEAGSDAFYQGEIAADMVAGLRALGGTHVEEDFHEHRSEYVQPISLRYRGVDILQTPPNSQGLVTLTMLNALQGFDLASLDPIGPERFHLQAEAARQAFEVRDSAIADPAFYDLAVADYLTEAFGQRMRERMSPYRALPYTPSSAGGGRDTVYVAVVDAERNVCSLINSLYFQFGSRITSPTTGILFHNRGTGFVVQPGHPNSVEPGKRPSHTILPGLAMKDGAPWLAFGVKGAAYQPIGNVQILCNILDYGMDVQEAIDLPRCGYNGGPTLDLERGIPAATRERLAALGHQIRDVQLPLGGAQAILIDAARGTLAAGSDPRKDGVALAY